MFRVRCWILQKLGPSPQTKGNVGRPAHRASSRVLACQALDEAHEVVLAEEKVLQPG